MSECPQRFRIRKYIVTSRSVDASRRAIKSFVGGQAVVVYRQVSHALGDGIAEAARWIYFAEQDVGNYFTFSFASVPLEQDCRNMLFLPSDG